VTIDSGRRSQLLAGKLGALVRSHFGESGRLPGDLPGAASLVEGTTAWVLLDESPVTAFGAALVWARRRGITDLHLIADTDAGVLARRAGCFTQPPTVWQVDGASLVAAAADPVPAARPAAPAPQLAEILVDAGLEVLVEDGLVRGELNGLEVARVVHGETTAGEPIDEPVLEVGVGKADRELTAMLHAGLPPTEQLSRVIEIVREHRRPGAPPHPLNQLVQERWLRARLAADPARIGLQSLRPVETAIPRANLREVGAAAGVGTTAAGDQVVVVCSVGIHLDLVPAAADTRLAVDPGAPLLLAVPARDAHPVTEALATQLDPPAEVVALEGDWRR
jgi:hypothetical protein